MGGEGVWEGGDRPVWCWWEAVTGFQRGVSATSVKPGGSASVTSQAQRRRCGGTPAAAAAVLGELTGGVGPRGASGAAEQAHCREHARNSALLRRRSLSYCLPPVSSRTPAHPVSKGTSRVGLGAGERETRDACGTRRAVCLPMKGKSQPEVYSLTTEKKTPGKNLRDAAERSRELEESRGSRASVRLGTDGSRSPSHDGQRDLGWPCANNS